MEYRMTLFVSLNEIDNFMDSVDLKGKHKSFVIPHSVEFSYEGEIKDGFSKMAESYIQGEIA